MPAVVLLATYNGARFLAAQLDSLFDQSVPPRWVLVRDDGSDDDTLEILADYRRRHPEQMRIIPNQGIKLGPLRQFSALLEYLLAQQQTLGLAPDYAIAFSDQDDVWDRQRLALGLARLADAQQRYGAKAPLLIHSDLSVIDDRGHLLHPRLSHYQGLRPERNGFCALLLQNVVNGCSALITPALARLSVPIPPAAAMHDWWIALTAALCGHIEYIDRPLVAYRQHNANVFGAQLKPNLSLPEKARSLLSPSYQATIQPVVDQARYLLSHSPAPLNRHQRLACRLIVALQYRSLILRLAILRTLRLSAALASQRSKHSYE